MKTNSLTFSHISNEVKGDANTVSVKSLKSLFPLEGKVK